MFFKRGKKFLIFVLFLFSFGFLSNSKLLNKNIGNSKEDENLLAVSTQELFDNGGSDNVDVYWKNGFKAEYIYSDGKPIQGGNNQGTKKWQQAIKGAQLYLPFDRDTDGTYKYQSLKELKVKGRKLRDFRFGLSGEENHKFNLERLDLSQNEINDLATDKPLSMNSIIIGSNTEGEGKNALKYLNVSGNKQEESKSGSDWFLGGDGSGSEGIIRLKDNYGSSLDSLFMDDLGDKWENVFPAKTTSDPKLDNLRQLSIQKAGLTSYSLFENKIATNFPNLIYVILSENNIIDLTLTKKSKEIQFLYLRDDNSLEMVSFVDDLNLIVLDLSNSTPRSEKLVVDFDEINKLTKLESLFLNNRDIKGTFKVTDLISSVNLFKEEDWEENTNKLSLDFSDHNENFDNIDEFNLNNRKVEQLIFQNINQANSFFNKFVKDKEDNKFTFEKISVKEKEADIIYFFHDLKITENHLSFANEDGSELKEYLTKILGFDLSDKNNIDLNDFYEKLETNVDLAADDVYESLTEVNFTQNKDISSRFKLGIKQLSLPKTSNLTSLKIDNFSLEKIENLSNNAQLTNLSVIAAQFTNTEWSLNEQTELTDLNISGTNLTQLDLTKNTKIETITTSYKDSNFKLEIIYGSDDSQKDKIIAALRKGNSYLDENWEDVKKNFFGDSDKQPNPKDPKEPGKKPGDGDDDDKKPGDGDDKNSGSKKLSGKTIALIVGGSVIAVGGGAGGIYYYARK